MRCERLWCGGCRDGTHASVALSFSQLPVTASLHMATTDHVVACWFDKLSGTAADPLTRLFFLALPGRASLSLGRVARSRHWRVLASSG
jgi:hypothetical protein